MKTNLNSKNQNTNNQISYNFFIRSANSLAFDLVDLSSQVKDFSTEQIFQIIAHFDNALSKIKVFKEELERRVKN